LSPGRRTNRKNLRNCQRTILFYAFYFVSQSKAADFISFIFNRVQVVHRLVTGISAVAREILRKCRAGREISRG
jgi:hypothetical protein